jgi:hypothetical protein
MLAAKMTANPVITERLRNDFILETRIGREHSNAGNIRQLPKKNKKVPAPS